MEILCHHSCKNMIALIFAGIFVSCSGRHDAVPQAGQPGRLDVYLNSSNEYVAAMFSPEKSTGNSSMQPALTQTELDILDALANRLPADICHGFDQKIMAWLKSWIHTDPQLLHGDTRHLLKCNQAEYHNLIDFCRQQGEEVLVLFHQLAARAGCPYDRFLLQPVHDLENHFPEFGQYWKNITLTLENEKPNLEDRTCNEATIWYTRKILESRYGYTYANRLSAIFD